MSLRLSILCGALFAAAALATGVASLADAPARAMRDMRARQTACALPGLRCAPPNVFLHQRDPASPRDAVFGPPDPSVLISSAWVDLSRGAVRLTIPPTGGRFFAVQVIDDRNATIALAEKVSVGSAGATLTMGASDANVRADGWVWIVARFAVTDEPDVPVVHDLQNALRIAPL